MPKQYQSPTKIQIAHAKRFGIPNVKEDYYSLIDRLQKCSELKYPEIKWSIDAYYHIAFAWIGKEEELKKQLEKLESELNIKT